LNERGLVLRGFILISSGSLFSKFWEMIKLQF